MQKQQELQKAICNHCKIETKHHIRSEWIEKESDQQIDFEIKYQTLQCDCSLASFRKRTWCSENQDYHLGFEWQYRDEYFPTKTWPRPDWLSLLAPKFRMVLEELYAGKEQGFNMLVSAGARTIVDLIANEKFQDDIGPYKNKLKKLQEGYNPVIDNPDDMALLDAVTDVGGAAAHHGHAPERPDLEVVVKIVERILKKVYVEPIEKSRLAQAAKKARDNAGQARRNTTPSLRQEIGCAEKPALPDNVLPLNKSPSD